jgi:hypothetical protein
MLQDSITLTTTGTSGPATLIGNVLNVPNYTTDLSGYVTLATDQTITGYKTILRGGDVLNFKIGTDTLYGLKVAYNQNELVPSGEATWSFVNTFNRNGTGYDTTPISFFRGVLVTGERLLSVSVNTNLLAYYGSNPTGRYPIYAYNTGVQQFASSIIVGETNGVVNAVTGAIADLPAGVVANFKGRVIGSDAVNNNEFATLGQVTSTSRAAISLTTTGTSGPATYSSVTGVLNIPEYQGGVTSFNTRTGAVTLTSSDVTTALGYTPVTDARTLTINGVGYDLTANRSWTVAVNPSAREIETFIATAGQTTFTVTGGYTVGLVDVFINGVRLTSSDFVATNGTTVVLTVGTMAGNIVDIIKYTSGFTNPIAGTLATGQVAFGTAANTIGGDTDFTYNSTTNLLTLGGGITLTGAQTIQTSTGNLTLATAGGNGNIILSPNGTGSVLINRTVDAPFSEKLIIQGDASASRAVLTTSANSGISTLSVNIDRGLQGGIDIIADKTNNVARIRVSNSSFWPLTFEVRGADGTNERWRITSTGVLQSNGAQTIQTSTGELTLATAGGNGNILLTPNGTGFVDVKSFIQIDNYAAGTTVPNTAGVLRILSGNKTGWAPNDELGKIEFFGTDTSGIGPRNAASIRAINSQGNGTTTTTFNGELAFYTSDANALETEKVRITSAGNLLVNTINEGIYVTRSSENTFGSHVRARKARGTVAAPTIVLNGDTVANLTFEPYNGTSFSEATGIRGVVNGTVSVGVTPTDLVFSAGSNGTAVVNERWRITSTGILQSNGAQTIQTSTGNLTLATGGGNGNIVLSPNGTGTVDISEPLNPILRLNNTTNTVPTLNNIGEIQFFTNDASVAGTGIKAFINAIGGAFGAAQGAAMLSFGTADNNSINAIERLRIYNTGNVVIQSGGTFTDAGFRLDVNGTGRFTSSVTAASLSLSGTIASGGDAATLTIKQAGTTFTNGIYLERAGERNGYYMYIGGALDALTFRRNYFGTQSDVMSLTRDGSVGIGTDSPNTKLHVVGSATINDIIYLQRSSSSLLLPVMNYWNGSGSPLAGTKGDIVAIGNAGGDGLVFVNANVERMRISSGNNVLIGTTTDNGARLQVEGTGRFSGKSFASGFTSRTGTISIASGVTSTITNMDVNGVFLVNIQVNGGSLIFNATNYFMANNTNGQYVNAGSLYDGANVTLSNSGSAIQITNGGFSTLLWHWSVFIMPYDAI